MLSLECMRLSQSEKLKKYLSWEIKKISVIYQEWLSEVLTNYEGDEMARPIIEGITTKDIKFDKYQYDKGLIKNEGKMYVGYQKYPGTQMLWEFHDIWIPVMFIKEQKLVLNFGEGSYNHY